MENNTFNLSEDFIKTMSQTLRQCGLVALTMQDDVKNIGKEVTHRKSDSNRLSKMREAKTKVDVLIQDILLISINNFFKDNKYSIDAEEVSFFNKKTDLKKLTDNIIVIDPIDGTLEYLEGSDNYSICLAWHHKETMKIAMVFFPSRNVLYYCTEESAYIVNNFLEQGLSNLQKIESNISESKIIYYNNRVPVDLINNLNNKGYTLVSDEKDKIGVPDVLLGCISGDILCYLSYTRQIRDILLGAIIAKISNGYAKDWEGNDLGWGYESRLPRGIFGCNNNIKNVFNILKYFSMKK